MPYRSICQLTEDFFNEKVDPSTVTRSLKEVSDYYFETENLIKQRLLESPFLHIDETPISIRGVNQYVWVFTNGREVFFQLGETREALIVLEFLGNCPGIVISDFYPVYESVECKQQKCWVHLVRDLNTDLWRSPFDREFEEFVIEVRNVIIPIMEAVQKYGLKNRNLRKFKEPVEKFYKDMIDEKVYQSELAVKYRNRFSRHRESLFTFLDYDGVPWHNNTVENAIRHLALQRHVSGNFYKSGAEDYLRLLGIKQTCRFQGKSFFKFLFSGETDLDQFKATRR